MRASPSQKEIQYSERVSVGIVAFVASAFTASIFGLITLLFGPPITIATIKFFVIVGLVISLVAAVVSATVGANKSAYLFGFIWGTTEATEKQMTVFLGVIILVCCVAIYFTAL